MGLSVSSTTDGPAQVCLLAGRQAVSPKSRTRPRPLPHPLHRTCGFTSPHGGPRHWRCLMVSPKSRTRPRPPLMRPPFRVEPAVRRSRLAGSRHMGGWVGRGRAHHGGLEGPRPTHSPRGRDPARRERRTDGRLDSERTPQAGRAGPALTPARPFTPSRTPTHPTGSGRARATRVDVRLEGPSSRRSP